MKIIIVGGVAGGASAAARARRLSESAQIILLERGPNPSFANCGMPYFIGGEIADRKKLLVTPLERLRVRYRLDVRPNSVAEKIDRQQKTLAVRNLETGETYVESYDKLILSPGAAPLRPPLPGVDADNIFTLRDLRDSDRIKAAVDAGAKSAIVVGAGFIGLEMAENLVRRGLTTTVVELADQILPPWDKELTTDAARHLSDKGVRLHLGVSVTGFERTESGLVATLNNGQTATGDLVVLSVGVRAESQLAVSAGLEVGPRGGIVVNRNLQTSDEHIYAVGDAIEVEDFVLKSRTQIPLAGPANRQGRLAADHIFGRTNTYRGTQGTAIIRVFDMTLAMTGASEKSLLRAGKPFQKIYIHPAHHAGYYPGAEGMTIKVLFDPATGRLLGAQAAGRTGVDKRIDVLAVAIQAGLSVFDLEEMELAYSPQFGSAKDPINMAGFVAAGRIRGDHPQLAPNELAAALPDAQLIDVRDPSEFAADQIAGASNIPVDELRDRLPKLVRNRPVIVYCQVGQRGYMATRILLQNGFNVRNLSGGFKSFRQFFPASSQAK